ncbi:TolC family outer membrane protein [Spiribacter aquaticus]|uniref:TolC family outer membrane protein n=2 Tax=Spiribacter aquaticus TaxID=1935996 RepID=A0A557RLT4_9GAMM|nr:TolC family outer membrane protein [Spiribacter roseus]TVO66137.1 TolC family outer membrane protein [Spiribacter aquaticus]
MAPRSTAIMLSLLCALGFATSATAQTPNGDDDGPLGLFQAYQSALDYAPVIDERQSLVDAGEGVVDQAKARRLPNLSLDARYTDARYETGDVRIDPETGTREQFLNTTTKTSYNYGINLTQPIYDRGVSTNLAEARARREVADAELGATRQALAAQVAEAYLRVLRARANRSLAQAEANAYRARWDQMERRLTRGLASQVDVLDARVRFETALSDIAQASNELDAARLGLERLTGRNPDQLLSATPQSMPLSDAPTDGRVAQWLEQAGRSNPTVAVERERLTRASETVSVRRAERFPRVSLEARYSDTNATDQLIQGTDARVLLRLQVPLFSGGGLTAGVDEARARRMAQSAALEDARRQAVIDTRAAVNELRNAQRRIQVSRQALDTAKAQVEASEEGLEVGVRDLVEVLDARAQLFSIRRDLAEAGYDYLIAQVRLKTTTGEFQPTDLRELDQRYLDEVVALAVEGSPD